MTAFRTRGRDPWTPARDASARLRARPWAERKPWPRRVVVALAVLFAVQSVLLWGPM